MSVNNNPAKKILLCEDDDWMAEDIIKRLSAMAEENGLAISLETTPDPDDAENELSDYDLIILDILGLVLMYTRDNDAVALRMRAVRSNYTGPIIIFSGMDGWSAYIDDPDLHEVHKYRADGLAKLALMTHDLLVSNGGRIRDEKERIARAMRLSEAALDEMEAIESWQSKLRKRNYKIRDRALAELLAKTAIERTEQIREVMQTGEWPTVNGKAITPQAIDKRAAQNNWDVDIIRPHGL